MGLEGLAKRIRQCAELVGSGDELARRTGIPRRTLETYLSGEAEPKASRLHAIAAVAKVSLDWLISGQNSAPGAPDSSDTGWVDVPLYDIQVSAGHGAMLDHERIITHLKFRYNSLARKGLQADKLCAVQVSGDSMLPTLSEGDTLLIDRTQQIPVGDDIFVIRLSEVLLAKRLQRLANGGIRIISDNPLYPPEALAPADLIQLAVLGRVVWFGRWLL